MKRLSILVLGCIFAQMTMNAQNVVAVPSTAEIMQKMALNAPYLYERYKSASTTKSVGVGLTLGGAAIAVIGFAVADKETITTGTYTETKLSGPGAGVFVAGMVSACVGTPLWIVGGIKKKNTRNAYIREFGYSMQAPVQPLPYLQLQVAPSRMGLALVF